MVPFADKLTADPDFTPQTEIHGVGSGKIQTVLLATDLTSASEAAVYSFRKTAAWSP